MILISTKFFFIFFFEISNCLKMKFLKNLLPLNNNLIKKSKNFFKKLCDCSQTYYSFSQQYFFKKKDDELMMDGRKLRRMKSKFLLVLHFGTMITT